MSRMLNKFDIPYAALIVKADARKKASIQLARSILSGFNIQVLDTEIPLLNAFENAETEGVTVDRAVTKSGRSDRRRMSGFFAYSHKLAVKLKCSCHSLRSFLCLWVGIFHA